MKKLRVVAICLSVCTLLSAYSCEEATNVTSADADVQARVQKCPGKVVEALREIHGALQLILWEKEQGTKVNITLEQEGRAEESMTC